MSRSVKSIPPAPAPLGHAARRRGAAPPATTASVDERRRGLCAMIFDDPRRVTDALHHRVLGRIDAPPHHHADLLQLDVIDGCIGEATLGEATLSIRGLTLIAVPAGMRHGYALSPQRTDAAVWLVKLRIGKSATLTARAATPPRTEGDPFPALLTDLSDDSAIRDEIAAFVADWTPSGVSTLTLTRLTAALARWPHAAASAGVPLHVSPRRPAAGDPLSQRIRAAIERLGQRFNDPPDLDELAAAAGVSARHFARRFRRDFGCTPHAWLAARRLDAARGLLRDADCRIAAVADRLGFSSPAAFSRWFTRLAGQSPRAFRGDPRNS